MLFASFLLRPYLYSSRGVVVLVGLAAVVPVTAVKNARDAKALIFAQYAFV